MEGKLRQVTDNIHGTIYLSDIESRMISTPFFYRLHDIYQSSTVYMTFPSNRTKRYEHCLGTMEQAGQMFFSSVTNTSKKIRQRFIDELYKQFTIIADAFKNRTNSAFYFNNTGDMLAKALPKSKFKHMDNLKALIAVGMSNGAVSDIALSHQSVCFFDLLGKHTQSSGDQHRGTDAALLYAFLYQCALQAVRIAALFHDIGIRRFLTSSRKPCWNSMMAADHRGTIIQTLWRKRPPVSKVCSNPLLAAIALQNFY